MNLTRALTFLAFVILISLIIYTLSRKEELETPIMTVHTVIINDTTIRVDLADTPETRGRGLSGRERLDEGEGMLFVFNESHIPGFWMKDMNFAIDIVWIDESREIIGIEREVLPETFPQTFSPQKPIKYVLELPSGYSRINGIDTGMIVYLETKFE